MPGKDSKGVLTMPALGQPFCLGMLYDCRTEELVPGVTLWDNADLKKDLVKQTQESSNFTIETSDTIEDKANALDVKASLKLSFLGGLIQVSGAARYLDDRTSSFHQERVTLKYSCATAFESLSMSHLGKGNVKHPEVFDHGHATHVVTGIMYGARAFFVFDKMHSESTWEREVEGELHAMVKAIPTVQIEGDAELKLSEEEKKKADTFNCRFYGDFKPSINPTTYQDAVRLYKELPKQLGTNNEKAVPITVWLYPLTNIDSKASRLVRDISATLVNKTEKTMEQLHQLDRKCNDLMKNVACQNFSEMRKEIYQIKEMIQQYVTMFQEEILPVLPRIRGGGAEEVELTEIMKRNENSVFSNKELTCLIEDKEFEIKMLDQYLKSMSDINFASSQADLNAEVMSPSNKFVVVYTMTRPVSDPAVEEMQNYLANPTHKTLGTGRRAKVADKTMVANARAFMDFCSASKGTAGTKFLITEEKADVAAAGGQIFLYKDGKILSKDFKPPNQCGPPKVSIRKHNSLTVTWSEPTCGPENITGYEVNYKVPGDSQFLTAAAGQNCNVYTLPNLQPAIPYILRVRALCEPGPGPYSPDSDAILTLPCSPPGKPKIWQTSPITVGIEWTCPEVISEKATILSYVIHYRKLGATEWTQLKSVKGDLLCTEADIEPNVHYQFCVSANCGTLGISECSPESDSFALHAEVKDIIKARLKAKSKRHGTKDDPKIYVLQLREVVRRESENIRKLELGKSKPGCTEKVIMVLGATGSGKTTLINGLANYVLGVTWKDDFRFMLITDENESGNQAHSQTQWITSYTIHHENGFQWPFTLTVIDTPGFGDTSGVMRDKKITDQIRSFFTTQGVGGIDHLDAVGFVAQSSLARLTPTQKYIFDSILALFGKDIAENIFLLLTFADGQAPPVLSGIKETGMPYQKFFKFNNSALYASNQQDQDDSDIDSDDDDEEGEGNFDKMFWDMGAKSFKLFLRFLNKTPSKTLSLTKDVLNERFKLEIDVQGIQFEVQNGLNKLEQLQEEVRIVRNHQADIDKNRDFKYTVTEECVELGPIDPGTYTTNCLVCKHTCHYPCGIKDNQSKRGCWAMTGENCRICNQKCHWSEHKNLPHKYEVKRELVTKTAADLKARYEDATKKKLTAEQLIDEIAEEFEAIQIKVIGLTEMIRKSLERLREIALKPNPLGTLEYIDILISSEEQEARPGWKERVEQYQKVRKQAEYMKKLAEDGYDPFEKYTKKIEEEKKNKQGGEGMFSRVLSSMHPKNWSLFKKSSSSASSCL